MFNLKQRKFKLFRLPKRRSIISLIPQIRAFAESEINLRSGDCEGDPTILDRDDIVEDTLVDMLDHVNHHPSKEDLKAYAREKVHDLVAEREREMEERMADTISTEDEYKDPDDVFTLGDEVLDFYVADEKLKNEDMITKRRRINFIDK